MTTFNASVAASSDDAKEILAGGMDLTSVIIGMSAAGDRAGFRFLNVTIPNASAGAVVTSAILSLRVNDGSIDSWDHTVRCEDVDDAATFTTTNNDISNRSVTDASISWSVSDSGAVVVDSPNLAALVNEVIARPGWSSGNDLVFISLNNNSALDTQFRTFDHSTGPAPAIAITWQYEKTVAGTLTSGGALVKQANKVLAGTLTSSGALATTLINFIQELVSKARDFNLFSRSRN